MARFLDSPADVRGLAIGSVCLLVAAAPFETLEPLVHVPGQNISSVETVLLAVIAVTTAAYGARRAAVAWRTPLTWPWLALVAIAAVSALLASSYVGNALHMTARFAAAFVVFVLSVNATPDWRAARLVALTAIATGVVVSVLMIGEYLGVEVVFRVLQPFRRGIAVVGSQVRAGGPFQYPTIASMYLEIAFALGLGLLVDAASRRRWPIALTIAVALLVVAEGVLVSFTRSGLISIALCLLATFAVCLRRAGFDATVRVVMAVGVVFAAQLLSSRSAEAMRLRMSTEGQDAWYRAQFSVPHTLEFRTGEIRPIPIAVTNRGRLAWDSFAAEPIRLSYHWIAADSDRVVIWEGERTRFSTPIAPGMRVDLRARVRAPGTPGTYRLVWDLEAVKRLWFSTEPDAVLAMTDAIVAGDAVAIPNAGGGPSSMPKPPGRPGRLVLWRAAAALFLERPILGIGPDNYRLRYGGPAGIANADPRVHSNNTYIELMVGTGLAGGLVLVWLAARVTRQAWRVVATGGGIAIGVTCAVGAIALHGLVDSFLGFTPTYIVMAVVSGLLVNADRWTEAHAHRV